MWVHIEDTDTWTPNLCLGWSKQLKASCISKVGRSQSHLDIGSLSSLTPPASAASAEISESLIDPFPCHCCVKFHGNSDGYCNAHRLARFYHNALSRCHLVFQYAELLMIFFVQAAADVESRALLALIVISLYPVLWMSLARLVGGNALRRAVGECGEVVTNGTLNAKIKRVTDLETSQGSLLATSQKI
eukprot:s1396_g22.t1